MKGSKILYTLVAMLFSVATFSQDLSEGFYRVQNKGSERYLYVKDCTGEVSTLGAEMGALELWPNLEDAISDPGSVMYFKKYDSQWDITSQNTGINELTGYYMGITPQGSWYAVYKSGHYLYEVGVSDFDENQGILGIKTSSETSKPVSYRLWSVQPISSSSDNYFGFTKTVTAKGKYYTSFYADFAYTPTAGTTKTWYVTKVDKTLGVAVIKEITGTVAKSQPVIIECTGANPSDNKVDLTIEAGNKAESNLMTGTYFCDGSRSSVTENRENPAIIKFEPKTMRVLGTDAEGNLALVNSSTNLVTSKVYKDGSWERDVACIPHNTSYIVVDEDCPATLKLVTEAEYEAMSTVPEDVNKDKLIDSQDVLCIYEFMMKSTGSEVNPVQDVNSDGQVDSQDVLRVYEYIQKH